MLYLDLAGVYLPCSLHSQTSLLYRAPKQAYSTERPMQPGQRFTGLPPSLERSFKTTQASLLYRAPNAAGSTLYWSTTLFGAIVQDDLSINPTTSGHSHTTHGCTAHKQAASSTPMPTSLAVTNGI